MEYVVSKSVTRSPCQEGEKPWLFHMVLGSSKGVSSTYLVDTAKHSVVLFDTIVKSSGRQY